MTDFVGPSLMLVYMAVIELPGHTIRFCEGGEFKYQGEVFRSSDPVFGSIVAVDDFTSGIGDEAPGLEIVFIPPSTSAAVQLSQPQFQGSNARFFKVRVDRDTGQIVHDKNSFVGVVDFTVLTVGRRKREVRMGFTTEIDRFFNTNKGNMLNSAFHKSVWPGEAGLDHTTGSTIPQPWGQKRTVRTGAGGSGGATNAYQSGRMVRH